jgi:protein-disulfide isomerase
MKRSALWLASIVCVALFAASQQSAGARSTAHQAFPFQSMALQATAVPTAAATVDPRAYDMTTATLFTSPDKVVSLQLPATWQEHPGDVNGSYTFVLSEPNPSGNDASVGGFIITIGDPATVYNSVFPMTTPSTSPKDFLDAVKASPDLVASATSGDVSEGPVGTLKGYVLQFTYNGSIPTIVSIRAAQINPQQVVSIGVYFNADIWATAEPVVEKMLASLTLNPDLIPTVTPTPALAVTSGKFSGIHQENLTDGTPILGDPKAKVILLEFADFSCPHCLEYRDTMNQVIDQFVRTGKARLMVRSQTFVGGPFSEQAAQAAFCAGQQGAYWDAYEVLFDVQASRGYQAFNTDTFQQMATGLKIDPTKLAACITNGDTKAILAANDQAAQDLQIAGVPALFYSIDGGKTFNFLPGADGAPVNSGGPGLDIITAVVAKNQ